MKLSVFRRSRELEQKIDSFFDKLSESSVLFRLAIRIYIRQGFTDEFQAKLEKVSQLETEADNLRREIEQQLYYNTLIPDSRGDVLDIIERVDEVLSCMGAPLWAFKTDLPEIPKSLRTKFKKLTGTVVHAVDELGLSGRAFFRSPHDVPAYNHKVRLYEKEADIISTELKLELFATDLELSQKLHLRGFVEYIDNVADMAEDVADRLSIYAIKRVV